MSCLTIHRGAKSKLEAILKIQTHTFLAHKHQENVQTTLESDTNCL